MTSRQVNKQPGFVFRTALQKPDDLEVQRLKSQVRLRDAPDIVRRKQKFHKRPSFHPARQTNHSHTANLTDDANNLGKTHSLISSFLPPVIETLHPNYAK